MEKLQEKFEKLLSNRWLTIAIILLLALVLRAVRPLVVDRITKDGPLYVYMVQDINNGDLNKAFDRNTRMPPLYLFMMLGLHKMGIPIETAGRLISIIAGALLIIPVYLIAEMVFNSRMGAMGAFLIAVNPDLIRSSAKIMRDSLFLLLLFAAVYFIMKAIKSDKWNFHFWVFAGVSASLGAAVRTETIEILGIAILAMLVELFLLFREKKELFPVIKRWGTGTVLMLMIYYVVSLPFSSVLDGTPSTWTIVDERIPGYFRSMFRLSEYEVIEEEDTL